MGDLLQRLAALADSLPEGYLALSDGTRRCSYQQLVARVRAVSEALAGLDCEVLALLADNSVDWVIVDLACQQAGIVCLPLPTYFTPQQMAAALAAAGAQLVLTDREHPERTLPGEALYRREDIAGLHCWQRLDAQAAEFPEGTGKITFTSGSTGDPKGVCLSSAQQWRVAEAIAWRTGLAHPRHLCLLPLATLLENLAGVMTPLLCGGSVFLPGESERGFLGSSQLDVRRLLACIDDCQPTTLILIPQLLTVLLQALDQGWRAPDSLQFIAVGGAKVAPQALRAARAHGLPVYQGYGLSECGSVVALNTPEACDDSAVGRPLGHCQVRIEDGEIVISGASFLGYLGDRDSWYPQEVRSGDAGSLEAGWLRVAGRRSNILTSSFGRNISPEWVEAALLAQPLLSRCVVFGEGEPFLTALLSAPERVTDREIASWLRQVNATLPDYARVRRWQRLEEAELHDFYTANGRPNRARIGAAFNAQLQTLFSHSATIAPTQHGQGGLTGL